MSLVNKFNKFLTKKNVILSSLSVAVVSTPVALSLGIVVNNGNVVFQNQRFASKNSVLNYVKNNSVVTNNYIEGSNSKWSIEEKGKVKVFDSPESMRLYVQQKYINKNVVNTNKDIYKYVDRNGNLNLTSDFWVNASASNVSRSDIKSVYKGSGDIAYVSEQEAKNSFLEIKDGYYYNGIYFDSKQNLKNYLISNYLPSTNLEYNSITIKGPNGSVSSPININNNPNAISEIDSFVSANAVKVLNYRSSTGQSMNITSKNAAKIADQINDKDLNYVNVKSNQGESRYVIDNSGDDSSDLIGPYFYQGSIDIGSFTNKSMWRKTNNVNKKEYMESKIDSMITSFFSSIINDDVSLNKFNAETNTQKPTLFRTLLQNEKGESIDVAFLEELRVLSPKLADEVIKANNDLMQGKKYSTFFKLPIMYSFLLQRIVSYQLGNNVLDLVVNYFTNVANFIQDAIEVVIMDKSLLVRPSDKKVFNVKEFFQIGNPEYNINTAMEYFITEIKSYSKLVAAMSTYMGAVNNINLTANLIPFESYDQSILFDNGILTRDEYASIQRILHDIYDVFSSLEYSTMLSVFVNASKYNGVEEIKKLESSEWDKKIDSLPTTYSNTYVGEMLKGIGVKNTAMHSLARSLLASEISIYANSGYVINGAYLSQLYNADESLDRLGPFMNLVYGNPTIDTYRVYLAMVADIRTNGKIMQDVSHETSILELLRRINLVAGASFGTAQLVGNSLTRIYDSHNNVLGLNSTLFGTIPRDNIGANGFSTSRVPNAQNHPVLNSTTAVQNSTDRTTMGNTDGSDTTGGSSSGNTNGSDATDGTTSGNTNGGNSSTPQTRSVSRYGMNINTRGNHMGDPGNVDNSNKKEIWSYINSRIRLTSAMARFTPTAVIGKVVLPSLINDSDELTTNKGMVKLRPSQWKKIDRLLVNIGDNGIQKDENGDPIIDWYDENTKPSNQGKVPPPVPPRPDKPNPPPIPPRPSLPNDGYPIYGEIWNWETAPNPTPNPGKEPNIPTQGTGGGAIADSSTGRPDTPPIEHEPVYAKVNKGKTNANNLHGGEVAGYGVAPTKNYQNGAAFGKSLLLEVDDAGAKLNATIAIKNPIDDAAAATQSKGFKRSFLFPGPSGGDIVDGPSRPNGGNNNNNGNTGGDSTDGNTGNNNTDGSNGGNTDGNGSGNGNGNTGGSNGGNTDGNGSGNGNGNTGGSNGGNTDGNGSGNGNTGGSNGGNGNNNTGGSNGGNGNNNTGGTSNSRRPSNRLANWWNTSETIQNLKYYGKKIVSVFSYAFIGMEMFFQIYDLFREEKIQDFYVYTTMDGTEFIWNGGLTVKKYFGLVVNQKVGVDSMKLIDPVQITMPHTQEYFYFNKNKYYNRSEMKYNQINYMLNSSEFIGNEHFKNQYMLANESNANGPLFNTVADLVSHVVEDLGIVVKEDNSYDFSKINKSSSYISQTSYSFSNGLTSNNSNIEIATNVEDNIRATKIAMLPVDGVKKDFVFPGKYYDSIAKKIVENKDTSLRYVIDNSANELKDNTKITDLINSGHYKISNKKEAEEKSRDQLKVKFNDLVLIESKSALQSDILENKKFSAIDANIIQANVYSVSLANKGTRYFANSSNAETYILQSLNFKKHTDIKSQWKSYDYKGWFFTNEVELNSWVSKQITYL